MASDVGGVVGGVIGVPYGVEVPESSIIIKLSPLAEDPHEPICAECLCHPKLTLNGDEALWLWREDPVEYEFDTKSNNGGGELESLFRCSIRSSRLPRMYKFSSEF